MWAWLVRHAWAVAWGVLAVLTAACTAPYEYHGTQLDPPLAPANFSLTNQDGQAVQLSDFGGQPILLFFGYTHCADECPRTLGQFKQIHDSLGPDAARVHFVFVTVDSARDTPARLKEYLAQFDPAFQGLTGEESSLISVYRTFGVVAQSAPGAALSEASSASAASPPGQPGIEGAVTHSTSVFLLDGQGQLRLIYTDIPWQDMASDIRQLLHS